MNLIGHQFVECASNQGLMDLTCHNLQQPAMVVFLDNTTNVISITISFRPLFHSYIVFRIRHAQNCSLSNVRYAGRLALQSSDLSLNSELGSATMGIWSAPILVESVGNFRQCKLA
jgi:hypothetical protein